MYDWIPLLYSRKLTEYCKPTIMAKAKIIKKEKSSMWSSLVVQSAKDLVLLLQQPRLLLWHGFDPWPGNFHMPWARPGKKKKKRLLAKD